MGLMQRKESEKDDAEGIRDETVCVWSGGINLHTYNHSTEEEQHESYGTHNSYTYIP